MKKIIFILSILFCLQTFAEDVIFTKANKEYTNQNYAAAISLYDSIISKNLESSELYYNLGNCYYKTQDWANAIWHYEKSLQLERNEKTKQNLELARIKIIDRIEPIPKLFYKKWWYNLISLYSTKIWQILSIICIWIVLMIQFTNYKKKIISDFFNITTLIFLLITYASYENNYNKKEGVIFSSTTIVKSAPTTESTNLFSLHSGSKVEILDSIGDWINIRISNGNSGWILQKSIEKL